MSQWPVCTKSGKHDTDWCRMAYTMITRKGEVNTKSGHKKLTAKLIFISNRICDVGVVKWVYYNE